MSLPLFTLLCQSQIHKFRITYHMHGQGLLCCSICRATLYSALLIDCCSCGSTGRVRLRKLPYESQTVSVLPNQGSKFPKTQQLTHMLPDARGAIANKQAEGLDVAYVDGSKSEITGLDPVGYAPIVRVTPSSNTRHPS